ncbi:MAG TPA: flavodoxin domain-containing protein [Thermomicrobiaceae bacterium]|nr:flavodoxin domain-containing protein [Thermomicrobiaceae bacterium]
MKVLIAVASKHGSTREIAEAIARELEGAGHRVEVRTPNRIDDVTAYGAAIVGSAVYLGNWLPEARGFVESHREGLLAIPVWLFSSGPIVLRNGEIGSDAPTAEDNPAHLDALLDATGARDHRVFVGKLDRHELNVLERLAVRAAKAPDGDFRDWDAIRGWAREIAAALPAPVEPVAAG